MKDFLLFCVECVVGFLRYIVGTIIAGIGFVMVLGGFTVEHWPVTVLGVPILLIGVWTQYRT